MEANISVEKLPHHEQMKFCLSRAQYRQGRKLTAVKVYTVNQESKYLIVNGVPAINITRELEVLCRKYGPIDLLKLLPDYPHEEFSEVYLVKYRGIKSARFAKKQLDGKSFYGGVFHVCYAPELESVQDTREKLEDRRRTIAALTQYKQDPSAVNPSKKKYTKPTVGNYLSRLRPELQDPNGTPHSRVDRSQTQGDSDLAKTNPGQLECSNSNNFVPVECSNNVPVQPDCSSNLSFQSQNLHITSEQRQSSNDLPAGSIIPPDLYKIPPVLLDRDVRVLQPVVSSEKISDLQVSKSSKSVNVNKPLLVPRSIKRSVQSPALMPNKKKIKVFGNKSILSYKSSADGDGLQ
ncbi:hypothetical protein Pcinc_026826 [Petrolisthes cinctipes]|uniref:RNA-binding protein 48 n=1 Tax=Petrolisthes cinctipes TaxID=88211 RepID=A0AAE1F5P1_PETCI|nr:hypothetical protein Pcinc_026826 [Petrolisthes cinctipes]